MTALRVYWYPDIEVSTWSLPLLIFHSLLRFLPHLVQQIGPSVQDKFIHPVSSVSPGSPTSCSLFPPVYT